MHAEIELYESVYKSVKGYYDKAKKHKQKQDSALKSRKDVFNRLEKAKMSDAAIREKSKMQQKRTKFWFEKFVWSISTNGYLIVGGRDATTNELLIKKYLEKEDVAFHTNIQGAAFVVLKNGSKAKEQDLKDTAQVAACFSKAWKEGFASIDVYSMTPDQISKTANTGEYLAKGSFVIRGERKWYKDIPLELSFGLIDVSKLGGSEEETYLPVCGSSSSLKKYSISDISQVTQGRMKKGDAAKKLNTKYFKFLKDKKISYITLDDYVKELPPGELNIR
jgi:hypothetical protein